jgi:hypothetical protein
MILLVDDIRDEYEICGFKHRERFNLPLLTNTQREILVRCFRDNTFLVKDYNEAVEFVDKQMPEMIYFDHDLGFSKTGYDFLKYVCDKNIFFEAYFHSANPVGRMNMEYYYNNWIKSL